MMQGTLGEDILFDFNKPQLEFDESVPAWIFRIRIDDAKYYLDLGPMWGYYSQALTIRYGENSHALKVIWDYEVYKEESTCKYTNPELATSGKMTLEYSGILDKLKEVGDTREELICYVTLEYTGQGEDPKVNCLDLVALQQYKYITSGSQKFCPRSISHTNYLASGPISLSESSYNTYAISNAFAPFRDCLETIGEYGEQPFFMAKDTYNGIDSYYHLYQYLTFSTHSGTSIFNNFSLFNRIPANLFEGVEPTQPFYADGMFSLCYHLETLPANLFAPLKHHQQRLYLDEMFKDCFGLTKIPYGFLKDIDAPIQAWNMFKGSHIEEVNADVFENCGGNSEDRYSGLELVACFDRCTRLKNIENALTKICTPGKLDFLNIDGCFSRCDNIESNLPPLWNIYHEEDFNDSFSYGGCFSGCTSSPSYWLDPPDGPPPEWG